MIAGLRTVFLVAAVGVAGPVGAGESVYFDSPDGTRLHAALFPADTPKAGLLIVHGMQSHAGWFEASGTGDFLAGHGVTALAYDRRGSGRSGGARGHTASAMAFLEDFMAAYGVLQADLARAGVPGAPIHVYANCFGARIAIPYVSAYPDAFASLIVTSPSTHMSRRASYGPRQILSILVAGDDRYFPVPLQDDWFVPSGDWLEWIQQDELGLREVTARFLKSTNELTQRMQRDLRRLEEPLFVVLAQEDVIVENQAIERELAASYRGPKALLTLPGPHYMDFSPARDRFRAALLEWLYHPDQLLAAGED